MSRGWFQSLLGRSGGRAPGVEHSYECSYCGATFEEWPGACPDCDGLVVRIVDGPVVGTGEKGDP